MGKGFEKQMKTIEDQGEKQIRTIRDNLKQLRNMIMMLKIRHLSQTKRNI